MQPIMLPSGETSVVSRYLDNAPRLPQGVLTADPAAQLVAPRAAKKEPRFLSEDEDRRLLRACSYRARDAAIVDVFLQTGMRRSELARHMRNDVDLPKRIMRDIDSRGSVRVQRKGGKVERIALNYKACQEVLSHKLAIVSRG